jgi:chromosomal replication initiator protein
MKELTSASLIQIGEFFGGKDHSTILHGINKIKKDIEEDPAKKTLVDNIINNIKN